jgi:hypothetical protein
LGTADFRFCPSHRRNRPSFHLRRRLKVADATLGFTVGFLPPVQGRFGGTATDVFG